MSFRSASASVPGPYHVQRGLPNQDAMLWSENSERVLLAVSDGAGSLSNSGEGARLAVTSSIQFMESFEHEYAPEQLPLLALHHARETLFELPDYRSYGATLVCGVLRANGELSLACVGDSFAVVKNFDGYSLLTGTASGEFANITELLTSDELTPVAQNFTGVSAVALSSDGLESVSLSSGAPHEGFWSGVFQKTSEGSLDVERLFLWLDSLEKLVDDTTLLCVTRES